MSRLTNELSFLEQQLHHAQRNAIDAELAVHGLSEIGHPLLLSILESHIPGAGAQAQRDLAELLHISPPAVANSLKSLERSGYVRREPDPGDARRNRVLLTDKGRRAVEGCHTAMDTVSKRMLDGFSPEEQLQLLSFRQRMLQNLLGTTPAQKEES